MPMNISDLSYLHCCFGSLKLFLQRLVSGQECAAPPLVFAQTALSDTRTQHRSQRKHGQPSLWQEKRPCPCQPLMPEARRNASISNAGFSFFSPSLYCASLLCEVLLSTPDTLARSQWHRTDLSCAPSYLHEYFSVWKSENSMAGDFCSAWIVDTYHFRQCTVHPKTCFTCGKAIHFDCIAVCVYCSTHQQKSSLTQHKTEQQDPKGLIFVQFVGHHLMRL